MAKKRSTARKTGLQAIREIPRLPAPQGIRVKELASRSFRLFCATFLKDQFYLGWSPDHEKAIRRIEHAVLTGGLFALAMPRGSGKTTLLEAACLWSMLYGHHKFVVFISADESLSEARLDSIKTQLETNDALVEFFPEVCYPIRALEGVATRCGSQHVQGKRTHIEWTAKKISLPTVAGSRASGATVRMSGVTGRIRGWKHVTASGETLRPSLALLDDLQTDESARSPAQCDYREQTVVGSILGLAGPNKAIACLMACTVIEKDDLADRFLNPERHPEWKSERFKLLYQFPKHMELWEEYAKILAEEVQAGGSGEKATAFYAEHREQMDDGAVVAWPERYREGEISALQHAMNLYFRDRKAFFAEYQNEPLVEQEQRPDVTADEIANRLSAVPRGKVPIQAEILTAFIDVHANLLFWGVAAFASDFRGWVIDYSTFPEQTRAYFQLRDAPRTLAATYPGKALEARIYEALTEVCGKILGRGWVREDGAEMRVQKCLIDANWGQSSDTIYQFCRESPHAAVLMPSHGRYVGASGAPLSSAAKKPGEIVGQEWRIPLSQGKRAIRYVVFDTNYWKSFLFERLKTHPAQPGALLLFGSDPDAHRLFADHLTAEHPVETTAKGRTVQEWRLYPGRDNHFLDVAVGLCVAASICGAGLRKSAVTIKEERKPKKLGDFIYRRPQA